MEILKCSNRELDGITLGQWVEHKGKEVQILAVDYENEYGLNYLIPTDLGYMHTFGEVKAMKQHKDVEFLVDKSSDIEVKWVAKSELENYKTNLKILEKSDRSRDGFTIGDKVKFHGKVYKLLGIDFGNSGDYNFLIEGEHSITKLEVVLKHFKVSDIEVLKWLDPNILISWRTKEELELVKEDKKETTPDNITLHKHEYSDTGKQGIDTVGVLHEKPTSDIKEVCTFAPSSHYEFGDGLNCMTFIEEAVKDLKGIEAFYIANAIKYLFRTTKKNGDDDLKKAYNYITLTLKKRVLL